MIKILHVFGQMNRGGAETGIMQALRRLDPAKFHFDFLVNRKEKGFFDEEIRALGSEIIYWEGMKSPLKSYKNFKKNIQDHGPYDIIHSRLHHFSGFVLLLAKMAGIPIRIAHSHSDISLLAKNTKIKRKIYYKFTKYLIRKYATQGIAVSQSAAVSLFGRNWESDPKYKVLYTGIDLEPYKKIIDKEKIRKTLNIPKNSFVIGHVGSFREPKNHIFLIKVFEKIVRQDQNSYLLLCGDGILRAQIEREVNRKSLSDKVFFTGFREDVPDLLLGAMDVFVLPSFYEGLPHVGIEAQAAGLPCFFSETITKEVRVINDLSHFLPINKGVEPWVKSIQKYRDNEKKTRFDDAYKNIQNTEFDITVGVQKLKDLYMRAYESCIRTRS